MITDPIGGVIVSMLDSSMVDRVFEPWSGQTKDYEIGICCFSVKHAALSSNVSEGTTNLRTDCWFSHLSEGTTNLRTDCWFSHLSEGTTNLRTDCWFSHLSEGGDKSTDRLLIQSSVWGRWQIYRRTVDSVICLRGATNLPTDCWFSHLHHHSIEWNFFSPRYRWKKMLVWRQTSITHS